MQAATLDAPHPPDAARLDPSRLRMLVLARIGAAGKGVTKVALGEDLAAYVSHRLSPAQWRAALEAELSALLLMGQVTADGARLTISQSGRDALTTVLALGAAAPLPATWTEMRDVRVMAHVLGLEKEPAKRLKALAKPDGLRAAILQKAYTLRIKGVATPPRLRAALAAVALDRAFGNRKRDAFGSKLGLSAKAGRKLAGQLARHPRDFGTDGRLVAALAAEQAGAVQTDMGALQQALLRRFLDVDKAAPPPVAKKPRRKAAKRTVEAPGKNQLAMALEEADTAPRKADASDPAPLAPRPDLAEFSRAVRQLAVPDAQGFPGNRKTFISHIWRRLNQSHAAWGLSEIEFKCMLAEAHRAGHVALANADLKDASTLKDVQDSAVVYKNAVFHFVRVEA